MKLVVLLGLSVTALAASCGDINDSAPRNKVHFCSGNLVLDENRFDADCPDNECTDAFCCIVASEVPEIVIKVPEIVIEESGPSEVVVPEASGESGTCGRVLSGSRSSRHVCKESHVLDYSKVNAVCGADGCDDETCCRKADPFHDCSTSEEFSPSKARFCCIEEEIGCKPQVCAAGAGILSADETTCCHMSCGECGGKGCYDRPGSAACCKTLIRDMGRPCSFFSAPCSNSYNNIMPPPVPMPFFPRAAVLPVPAPRNPFGLYTNIYIRPVAAPIAMPMPAAPGISCVPRVFAGNYSPTTNLPDRKSVV